jgi:hypothetical protein
MINLLKSCFAGHYALKQITRNEKLSFTGTSIFEPIGNEKIRLTKKGSYILNGQEQEFFQVRYLVLQPGRVIMEKYEESLLHEFIVPDNHSGLPLTLHHSHYSNDDAYYITLKILSLDEFQTEYIIKGPKKDESIQSFYSRIH